MDSINPYASPKVTRQLPLGPVSGLLGAWQSGALLVVTPEVQLPDRCVKCNTPVDSQRMRFKLAWHSPAAFLGLLGGLLPYVLLAIIMQKKQTLHVGVCPRHRRTRRNAIIFGVFGSFAGLVLIILRPGFRAPSGAQVLAGIGLLFGAILYGVIASRIVWAKKIGNGRAWVKGVCREYLDDFPEYPLDSK